MAESVTASLAAGIIVAVLAVMALVRTVKRRASSPDSESQPIEKLTERDERPADGPSDERREENAATKGKKAMKAAT
jgi:hypothetical protein